MKLLGLFLTVLLLAAAVQADDDISGKITAIDTAAGTLEISGVKIMAKDAKVEGVLIPSSLAKFKVGDKVRIKGAFTGPLQMRADKIEKKIIEHYEINATLDNVDAKARVLKISGITIPVPEGIMIEDTEDEPTTIDKLEKGKFIEVEGKWTGKGEFTADKIEMYKEDKEEEKEKD